MATSQLDITELGPFLVTRTHRLLHGSKGQARHLPLSLALAGCPNRTAGETLRYPFPRSHVLALGLKRHPRHPCAALDP